MGLSVCHPGKLSLIRFNRMFLQPGKLEVEGNSVMFQPGKLNGLKQTRNFFETGFFEIYFSIFLKDDLLRRYETNSVLSLPG